MQGEVTEATYASDLKEWINQVLEEEPSLLRKARVEVSNDRRRADILVYGRQNRVLLVIEVKRPETSPFEMHVRRQAADYARGYAETCKQYATHNVNFLVLWDSRTQAMIEQFAFTYVRELHDYLRDEDEIKRSLRRFLRWYVRFLEGAPPAPLDESIVRIVNRSIKGIIETTDWIPLLSDQYVSVHDFRRNFQQWLVERGWSDPGAKREILDEYCKRLASQFLYLFVNKVLFYNVLREKYPSLSRLELPDGLNSEDFHPIVSVLLESAMRVSKDYQTVFETDFVDRLPLTDLVVGQIQGLMTYLNSLDYATMGNFDVIGKVFEHLIPVEERHLHGQFFTRTDLVDLLLGFSLRSPESNLLDPACGSGTFLVRAYHRMRYLREGARHADLIPAIWGVDLDKFAAHFSTVNLARQDLVSQENYPNVIQSDFFRLSGPNAVVRIGLQTSMLDWASDRTQPTAEVTGLDTLTLNRTIPFFATIAGNPPFTEQRELMEEVFGEDYKDRILSRLRMDFPGIEVSLQSGIYVYFVIHALRFLKAGGQDPAEGAGVGRLAFIMLRNWLDVDYGEELKRFLLSHAKIGAILESRDEEWFPSAQMLPIALYLESARVPAERETNHVRFVQIQKPLSELIPPLTDERNRLQELNRWQNVDQLVRLIEAEPNQTATQTIPFGDTEISLTETDAFRIVRVPQSSLSKERKWSLFLSAPKPYFLFRSRKAALFSPLSELAERRRGLTSPKAAFFYFPNPHFVIRRGSEVTELMERRTADASLQIENRFLEPMLLKIKRHQAIEITEADGFGLFIPPLDPSELEGTGVKKYLDYGDQLYGDNLTRHGTRERPWYSIPKPSPAPILLPSLYLARYAAFWNPNDFVASNPFFEVRPHEDVNALELLAIMNSSLTALMLEFSGRYRENRDRTITNQISLDDMARAPILDPRKLTREVRTELREAVRPLLHFQQSADGLVNPRDIAARKQLDEIIFLKALDVTVTEMQDAIDGLSRLISRRLRLGSSEIGGTEDEEQ